ncbi:uncharacterized protein MONBRDRAFT_8473 [Monosiga brevicollis MX1]|uniref:ATP-dependent DNA ligase family profile domain-containing protein n=1 Tax=Monosiga brevicollis TaxID=81824 RepID=A9V051_MONBE|nr:uncharacterized protein MONBRDRAFT_8473 [Monosiga brevicollis MX1]EDQ88950.1 predicted protein [Monosiga brevicollis MX1]|eukprot:XP_001746055.1 hypothetical protein [Monosiga brevicollis MX1]
MNRGRKDVNEKEVQVAVKVLLYDLMMLDDRPLLQLPLRYRTALLQHVGEHDESDLRKFLHAALDAKCEGLMIKARGPPSKRCENWLKASWGGVKKDYLEGLGDSFDLVVIGGWWGNGRKAGWFSPLLLACYNPETELLESVCKVMSGFTDEFYKELTAFYSREENQCAKKSYYDVAESMTPSVWFEPVRVWEIRGADLTVSPVHRAGHGLVPGREAAGISLRFPRFIRERPDKTMSEATTAHQIVELYQQQFAPAASRRLVGDEADAERHDEVAMGGLEDESVERAVL